MSEKEEDVEYKVVPGEALKNAITNTIRRSSEKLEGLRRTSLTRKKQETEEQAKVFGQEQWEINNAMNLQMSQSVRHIVAPPKKD
mmetsp:Transcript_15237/g.23198  ORF Transcript_15237/g.23198 Transcript_15237/m.23198 type:complete len:85 (-) Transcript_15237:188-442(-)|eukprot:CAMPEP_0118691226 /NCGR_PEP_ID=MMETSP0800-20121206/10558_1 /TAXON_ID=210618 ORGANISM="Striatella unipunctata, Strain CCMP2910" /NCGR_SAMPLE_ID=MMETSP0800 /ASSEMBLY_ACC=CAM_ASM_000638 /LENGTH=84 /DNA_ID=CAMNT_0006588973 /DNA_START=895 /DNA_END=1149 /DNA_ORIENTATION=-